MPAPRLPPCPVCGLPTASAGYLLTAERKHDGKKNICQYVVFCREHGARWKWEDRQQDDQTYDAVITEWWARG